MVATPQQSPSQRLRHSARWLRLAVRELGRYLLYLRVPLLLLSLAAVAFTSQQVSDVLLAMALEPEWGAFGMAALAAALFGVALWFSARSLSERRWMALQPAKAGETAEGMYEAIPLVHAMSGEVVWWLPRLLGMAPMLLMATAMLWRVGDIGTARPMALLLILEATILLLLLYARTRVTSWLEQLNPLPRRFNRAGRLSKLLNLEALTIRSGNRVGLFSSRSELVLMAAAWMILALISMPIARAAYGPFGGGSLHIYGVLLGGAVALAFDRIWEASTRRAGQPKPSSDWRIFGLLFGLALLVPLLLNASGLSAVAIPRLLGSIAILYLSLAIFSVFASSFFRVGTTTGFPLLSLFLVGALVLASFRINDNHAVRLLDNQASPLAPNTSSKLPSLEESFNAWLDRDGRRKAIQARGKDPWPVYVVSAQGGGVYAAYHAAKALALLSQEVPAFPQHLFALSGVSGGSVGSTIYLNALRQATGKQAAAERIDESFEQDQLSTVLAAMLFPDATQRFYPWAVPAWDRALGLELSFSDGGSRTPVPVSLEGSFYRDQQGPFLVLNTTEVKSGRRFLLSPFQFKSDSTFHTPDNGQDLRFSTAAVMSARFPLITPYAFFNGSPSQRQRRTVDGGYYDNSGAVTASEIVQALRQLIREDTQLNGKMKVIPIAIVGISSFDKGPPFDNTTTPATVAVQGNKPLLSFSAVDALFAAREARVSKSLSDYGVSCSQDSGDSLCITLQTKYRFWRQTPDAAWASKLSRQPAQEQGKVRDIPLGWTLSCQARAFITQQLALSDPSGPVDLACLQHQGVLLQLKPVGPVAGEGAIPSFADVVGTVRDQVQRAAPATGSPAGAR